MQEQLCSDKARYYQIEPYSTILSAIGNGSENARHKNQLVRLTGMNERALRKSIEHLRRENFVIISDENGYYFPQSQKELEIYVQTVSKRARSTFYTLKSARQTLKQCKKCNE